MFITVNDFLPACSLCSFCIVSQVPFSEFSCRLQFIMNGPHAWRRLIIYGHKSLILWHVLILIANGNASNWCVLNSWIRSMRNVLCSRFMLMPFEFSSLYWKSLFILITSFVDCQLDFELHNLLGPIHGNKDSIYHC